MSRIFQKMNIENIYTDMILELYRNPVNKGEIDNPSSKQSDVNPFCGDKIEISLRIENDKIREIKFNGSGCAISQASASLLTEIVKGKTIDKVLEIDLEKLLEELHLEKLKHNPARIKCVALSLKVLKMALYDYLGKKDSVDWNTVIKNK